MLISCLPSQMEMFNTQFGASAPIDQDRDRRY
jgi:hypothetical protein